MDVRLDVRLLDAGDFGFLAVASSLLAVGSLYFAFNHLRRARLVEDTPTARIRSAPQGYVELVGKVAPHNGEPLRSPLTGSPCCWYRFKIERRGQKDWETLEQGESPLPFVVDDGTERCLVDPRGAEVTPTDRSLWYGWSRFPEETNPPRIPVAPSSAWVRRAAIHAQADVSSRYRYSEERIYPGDQLYAIGHFDTLGEAEQARERHELLRQRLVTWKQDRAGLLARFDSNRDGEIDPEEWERVRQSAAAQVDQDYASALPRRVLHRLRKDADRRKPFLLSSLPQRELARRHRLYAGIASGLFLAAGAAATFLIARRFF